MNIRIAETRDAGAIVDFNIAMALETEEKVLCSEVVKSGVDRMMGNSCEGFYVVAEDAGNVIACLMITREWSDWRDGVFWWVQSVYVLPQARNRGVFRMLYDHVRKLALSDGDICGLRLYVEKDNTSAQKVYDKLGMEETNYKMYEEVFGTEL